MRLLRPWHLLCFVAAICFDSAGAVLIDKTVKTGLKEWQDLKPGLKAICNRGKDWWQQLLYKRKELNPDRTFYHLHIPKTAGISFASDFKKDWEASAGNKLDSHEGCYGDSPHAKAGTVAMLRHPRAHVLSQYNFCATSTDKGPQLIQDQMPSSIGAWLQEWRNMRNNGTAHRNFTVALSQHNQPWCATVPFKCYNPLDLQSHRFTCEKPYQYPDKVDVGKAIQNMRAAFFVGIVEAYKESQCVLHEKVHHSLPEWCDCEQAGFHESSTEAQTHGAANHSVDALTADVLSEVDNFTANDRKLYTAAVQRFLLEAEQVEQKHGHKIVCNAARSHLSQLAGLSN